MGYFTKRYHPPGTPPGTLVAHGTPAHPLRLRLLDFTADGVIEEEDVTPETCKIALESEPVTWIDAHGTATPELLQKLGETFGLHPLALEDVLNTGQRPKLEKYEQQLFIIMSMPMWRGDALVTEQVSLFLGGRYLISFHNGETDIFEPVRKRLRATGSKMRMHGADYLLYALLDLIVDEGFPILEDLGEQIEALENELLDRPSQKVLTEIHDLKRNLLMLRRMLWPQREVLNHLLREDEALIHAPTRPYLRDCYDHTVQIMDLFENYRDMASSMLDIYLSSASQRLNEIMRVLTVITTLFIPPTFLVGVYGMNFDHPNSPWAMPELHSYYGYPIVWLVIIAMITGMLIFFKRRGWF